jgi:hypothetical protein
MTEKEKKFLSDISNSIELIENFTKDLKSFSEYQKDLKTKECPTEIGISVLVVSAKSGYKTSAKPLVPGIS